MGANQYVFHDICVRAGEYANHTLVLSFRARNTSRPSFIYISGKALLIYEELSFTTIPLSLSLSSCIVTASTLCST